MGLFSIKPAEAVLSDLLKRERDAIMAADFATLEGLMREKERAMEAVTKADLAPETLKRLRDASERNALLLDAMRDGIGSAIERLRVMREPPPVLNTYDARGRKTPLEVSGPTAVQRL